MPEQLATYDLTFLRHGESEGNRQRVIQGQADYPLNATGRQQAAALGRRWLQEGRHFDGIIASPLSRASETAEIVATELGTELEIELDPVWMERDFGRMSGVQRTERYSGTRPSSFVDPYSPLGETGESILELFLRGGKALLALLARPPGSYLVVSHGGLLNMTLYAALGIAPQPDFQGPRFDFRNAAFAMLSYEPGVHRWHIMGLNDRTHWRQPA